MKAEVREQGVDPGWLESMWPAGAEWRAYFELEHMGAVGTNLAWELQLLGTHNKTLPPGV